MTSRRGRRCAVSTFIFATSAKIPIPLQGDRPDQQEEIQEGFRRRRGGGGFCRLLLLALLSSTRTDILLWRFSEREERKKGAPHLENLYLLRVSRLPEFKYRVTRQVWGYILLTLSCERGSNLKNVEEDIGLWFPRKWYAPNSKLNDNRMQPETCSSLKTFK